MTSLNEPGANGFDYRKNAELTMDAWGRLIPAANRFPSAAHGAGFKPLAENGYLDARKARTVFSE